MVASQSFNKSASNLNESNNRKISFYAKDFNSNYSHANCNAISFDDRSNLNEKKLNGYLNSFESNNLIEHHIRDSLNKSSVSLSELDNIKKQTINDLKSYKTKSQFRTKFVSKLNAKYLNRKHPCFDRLIRKNGESNVNIINKNNLQFRYISDMFNTIVDMKWRYLLFIFWFCFLVSWVFFAIIWFMINYFSNEQCISNVENNYSFFDLLLFSIETQQTIGYGYRFITSDCKLSLITLMIQCAFSVLLNSFLGGAIFVKLSRPKKRTETLIFSKVAVIAPRDNVYCLMVRVGDLRRSHIIQSLVHMYLIKTRYTQEGEIIPCNAQELKLTDASTTDCLLFMPIIVEHKINKESPLYEMISFSSNSNNTANTNSFSNENFEIIVTLKGTVESTGASTQARTSFLPSEIQWNHVFETLFENSPNDSKATIDFSKFNNTRKIQCIGSLSCNSNDETYSNQNEKLITRKKHSIFSKTHESRISLNSLNHFSNYNV